MKLKIFLAIVLIVSMFFIIGQIPAKPTNEFSMAKKIALSSAQINTGDYGFSKKVGDTFYFVFYSPSERVIIGGMIKGDMALLVQYQEDNDIYVAALMHKSGEVENSKIIPEKEANEFMSKVLSKLSNSSISY